MNVETDIEKQASEQTYANVHLLKGAFAGLNPLVEEIRALNGDLGDAATVKAMRRLRYYLSTVEPAITMIGQVKAGKTTLVNALSGMPGLLPADVNPWTSVVTSLHFDPRAPQEETRASFQFFEADEWDRLVNRGGRIGELASRTGAEDELERVCEQIDEMREKSRRRLGRKFEMLLGQRHDYGYFDSDLIERYVCLGDDFENEFETDQNQGRFADITKSAELFLSRPEFPMRLCIRDTPGVNDTFMMREQITIRATRESRICVVVLSAHQALSSVDMALIRLIANVRSREVVVFVNRIDELSDPASQIPEIRDSIRVTLKKHQGPEGAEIIFGSGHWANIALSGEVNSLEPASAKALHNLAAVRPDSTSDAQSTEDLAWELSGQPELCKALSDRIVEGVGREAVVRVTKCAINHAKGLQASGKVVEMRTLGHELSDLDTEALKVELDRIESASHDRLSEKFEAIIGDFNKRLERSHRSFLERATSALISHLELRGDQALWQYDPTGLRVLLRTAYRVFATNSWRACDNVLTEAATDLNALYSTLLSEASDGFSVETPEPPRAPPPVLLGQTIALDLKGTIWSRWWRKKRGPQAYAREFADLIRAETDPIIMGLRETHAQALSADATKILEDFLADQRAILGNVAASAGGKSGAPIDLDDGRQETLQQTLERLAKYAA